MSTLPRPQNCVLDHRYVLGTLRDFSGNANNGVGTGVNWEPRPDLHVRFTAATTDNIMVANSPSLQFTAGEITVFCYGDFIKQHVLGASGLVVNKNSNPAIGFTTVANQMYWFDGVSTRTATVSYIGTKSLAVSGTNGAIPKAYKDGVFVTNFTGTVTLVAIADALYIGNQSGQTRSIENPVKGILVYNVVLLPDEIATLHQWSQEIRTPRKIWPGVGLARPSTLLIAPVQSNVVNGPELVVDGDMEAIGTAAWTVGNAATLTKESATPHGGLQCLRVAYNGVGTPNAAQVICTVGKIYRAVGWAYGDTVYLPLFRNSGTTLWTGTAVAAWQKFDCAFVASADGANLASTAVAAGYSEFDDVSVVETSERLSDGDAEATSTSMWTLGNAATLSKETGTPYQGTQVFRIAHNGTADPYARQTTSNLVVGAKYRVRGVARSDGTAVPRVNDSAVVLWTGTNATAWQPFDFQYTATTTEFRLYGVTAVLGQYVEFDALSATPVGECVAAWDLGQISGGRVPDTSGYGNVGTVVQGVQVVRTPTGKAAKFNGTTGRISCGSPAGSLINGFTLRAICAPNISATLQYQCGSTTLSLSFTAANMFSLNVAGLTDTAVLGTAKTAAKQYHVVGTWDRSNLRIYVDGVLEDTDASTGTPTGIGAWYLGTIDNTPTSPAANTVKEVALYTDAWSDAEVAADYRRFATLNTFNSFSSDWCVSLASEGGVVNTKLSNTPFKFSTTAARYSVIDDSTVEGGRAGRCDVAGTLFTKFNHAYGTWEIDICKVLDAGVLYIDLVANTALSTTSSGYVLIGGSTEKISLAPRAAGVVGANIILQADTIVLNTWYKLRTTRTAAGIFYIYILGGVNRNWTLLGTGTNTTYTNSSYALISLNAGDKFANFRHYAGVVAP